MEKAPAQTNARQDEGLWDWDLVELNEQGGYRAALLS
jgi:hypothetical protein